MVDGLVEELTVGVIELSGLLLCSLLCHGLIVLDRQLSVFLPQLADVGRKLFVYFGLAFVPSRHHPPDGGGQEGKKQDYTYGYARNAVLGAALRLSFLLQPVVVELSAVACQALGRCVGVERVFQVIETVELHFCTVGLRVPQTLIKAAPGMHLIGHVAHFLKNLCRLAVEGHRLCLTFLAQQCHPHLIVGDGQ